MNKNNSIRITRITFGAFLAVFGDNMKKKAKKFKKRPKISDFQGSIRIIYSY